MARITISIANLVKNDIVDAMNEAGYNNQSEFVEELIRLGLAQWKKRDQ